MCRERDVGYIGGFPTCRERDVGYIEGIPMCRERDVGYIEGIPTCILAVKRAFVEDKVI